jgi:hypothetical protein
LKSEWKLWREWAAARRLSHRVPPFTPDRLSRPSRQQLPSLTEKVKAMDCRLLLHWNAERTFQMRAAGPDGEGALRHLMAWSLAECLRRMDSCWRVLSHEEAREVSRLGKQYLQAYGLLRAGADRREEVFWRTRPKCHYLEHCWEDAAQLRVNLKHQSLFWEEDHIRCIAKVSRRTHRKVHMRRTLERWSLQLRRRLRGASVKRLGPLLASRWLALCDSHRSYVHDEVDADVVVDVTFASQSCVRICAICGSNWK